MSRSAPSTKADAGLTAVGNEIMGRLLRMRPEQQKATSKPDNAPAEAQRRRRQRERLSTEA